MGRHTVIFVAIMFMIPFSLASYDGKVILLLKLMMEKQQKNGYLWKKRKRLKILNEIVFNGNFNLIPSLLEELKELGFNLQLKISTITNNFFVVCHSYSTCFVLLEDME